MPKSVSSQYLLEGAVYALEQCGLLLRDANLLYRSGSFASAVALSAFAREELGRWRILLDLRKKVVGGESLTIEKIQAHCDDHVTKQRAGMLSLTMRTDRDSVLGKLLETRMKTKPGSQEWKELTEQIGKLDRQKERRTPDDRHRQRMSALYVDAGSSQWSRPAKEISHAIARDFLTDAVNDYVVQRSQGYTDLEIRIKDDDPELYNALVQWSDRPELPHPEWPSYEKPSLGLRSASVAPLGEREAHLLALLMPLILVCDIAAFTLCFWWYDLGLPLSIVAAIVTPIVLLLVIVTLVRFWPTGSKTRLE
jgi:AbiV family abortive infection protein